jgi:hypothetical protein
LRFIEDVGLDAAFDLIEIIEGAVPAGGPRKRGPAFTAEQNVELLRRLASGRSLRKLADELAYQYPPLPGQNAPAYPPTHGAVRDRRDDLWRAIAAELHGAPGLKPTVVRTKPGAELLGADQNEWHNVCRIPRLNFTVSKNFNPFTSVAPGMPLG